MIQRIKTCKELLPYLCVRIEDEGIQVGIDESIEEDKIAIVKVDDYYNGLHVKNPPKSVDFCVLVDCECEWYCLYLLELKNVSSPKFLVIKDIHEKFYNTINDFLSWRFKDIFLDDKYKYKAIRLYLISDAYGLQGRFGNFEEYKRIQEKRQRIRVKDSLRVDVNLSAKLFRFKGRTVSICFDIPPNPVIMRIS